MSRPPRKSGPGSPHRSGGSGDGRRPPSGGGSRFGRDDGPRKPFTPRDGDAPRRFNRDDGSQKRYGNADSPRKPYAPRDADRPRPYGDRPRRDSDAPKRFGRDSDAPKRFGRDGNAPNRFSRDGDGPKRLNRDDGPRKPYAPRDGERPRPYGDRPRRDGDAPRQFKRDGDGPKRFNRDDGPRKPYAPRDGDRPRPYADRPRRDGDGPKRFNRDDGPRKTYAPRDGDRPRPYADRPRRDGDGPKRFNRDDGPRKPYPPRDGDRPRPYGDRPRRDGDAPKRFSRDGDAPKRFSRDGDAPRRFNRDDGPPKRFGSSDGPRKPYAPRDGDRPRPFADRPRFDDGARKPYTPRDGDAPRRPFTPRDPDAPKRGSRDPGDRPAWKSSNTGEAGKQSFKKRDPEDEREARRIELQQEERARKLAERAVLAEQFPKRDELVRKRRASRAVEAVLDERKRAARKTAATRFKDESAAPPRSATRSKLTAHTNEPIAAAPQPVKLAPSSNKPERIAKQLARAGVGSRRDIEQMIAAGRIAINGEELTHPAHNVTNLEGVTLDGEAVSAAIRTTLYAFYKPVGCVTAARDEEGRTTVFDLLPEDMPRMISIGRLDYNTEGLLLLTNDGELARHLELPENHYPRSYRVRVFGRINEGALERLEHGVTIDGVRYGEVKASLERSTGANHWLAITIYEGKNREVRRICEYLGLTVSRLIRVGFGPFLLDELKEGHCVEIERSAWTAELPPPFGHGRKPKTPEGVKSKHIPRGRDADHRR
jgi:23S rRNA pseudouridine2605 synthase